MPPEGSICLCRIMKVNLGKLWNVTLPCLCCAKAPDHLTLHLVTVWTPSRYSDCFGSAEAGKRHVTVQMPYILLEFPILWCGEAMPSEEILEKGGLRGRRSRSHGTSVTAAQSICDVIQWLSGIIYIAL